MPTNALKRGAKSAAPSAEDARLESARMTGILDKVDCSAGAARLRSAPSRQARDYVTLRFPPSLGEKTTNASTNSGACSVKNDKILSNDMCLLRHALMEFTIQRYTPLSRLVKFREQMQHRAAFALSRNATLPPAVPLEACSRPGAALEIALKLPSTGLPGMVYLWATSPR